MEQILGLPLDASKNGYQIDHLIVMVHWLMLVLFVGWGIFYVYTLIKFRKSNHPKADYAGVKTHMSSYIEYAIIAVEALLLIGFSIPIWARVVTKFPDDKDATVVRVVAEQFAWNIHYSGADGKFGKVNVKFIDAASNPLGLDPSDPNGKDDISTVNQLHLPVDKPVVVYLNSKDVIHSFGLPNFRVKQDAIPGETIPLWFEPAKTGKFEIVCSQLCGIGHYRMRGEVTIDSKDEFSKWMADQQAAKQSQGAGGGFWN
jgi:cytochrome c oxidase subunit 2